jgi:hypothetical protein
MQLPKVVAHHVQCRPERDAFAYSSCLSLPSLFYAIKMSQVGSILRFVLGMKSLNRIVYDGGSVHVACHMSLRFMIYGYNVSRGHGQSHGIHLQSLCIKS